MKQNTQQSYESPRCCGLGEIEDIIGEFAAAHLDNDKQMRRIDHRKVRCNSRKEEQLKEQACKKFRRRRKGRKKAKDCNVKPHGADDSVISEDSVLSDIFKGVSGQEAFYIVSDMLGLWYGMSQQSVVPKSVGVLLVAVQQYFGIPMTRYFCEKAFGEDGPFSKLREMTLSDLKAFMEQMHSDWTLAKLNDVFGHVWKFLVAVGAVIYGSVQGTEINRGFLLDIIQKGEKIARGSVTMMTAIIDTVTYVVKSFSAYLSTGSWRSFLHKEDPVLPYRNSFNDVSSMRSKFNRGLLADTASYESTLMSEIARGSELSKIVYGYERTIVVNIRDKLTRWHNDLVASRQEGCLRPATLCIFIASPSSFAKSTVMELTGRVSLQAIGMPSSHEYFYTWPRHKHWNGFKSYKQCIKADDMYCSLSEEAMDLEKDLLMRVNNNSTFKPEMADLEEKANTFFDAKVLVASANGYVTSKNELCKVANMRRWHIIANLRLTEDHIDPTTNKVNAKKLGENGPIPDAWRIDLYKVQLVIPQTHLNLNKPDFQEDARFEPLYVDDKKMFDLTIREYLLYVGKYTREHFKIQKSVLATLETFNREDIVDENLCIREEALAKAYADVRAEEEDSPSDEFSITDDSLVDIVDGGVITVKTEASCENETREEIVSALRDTITRGRLDIKRCKSFLLRVYGAGTTSLVEGCLKALEFWFLRNRHLIYAFMVPQLAENNYVGHAMVNEMYKERIKSYVKWGKFFAMVPVAVGASELLRISCARSSYNFGGPFSSFVLRQVQTCVFHRAPFRQLHFLADIAKFAVGATFGVVQHKVQRHKYLLTTIGVVGQLAVRCLPKIHLGLDHAIAHYRNLLHKRVNPQDAVNRSISVGLSTGPHPVIRTKVWFHTGRRLIERYIGRAYAPSWNSRLKYRFGLCTALGFLSSPQDWADVAHRQFSTAMRQPEFLARCTLSVLKGAFVAFGCGTAYQVAKHTGSPLIPLSCLSLMYASRCEQNVISQLSYSASGVARSVRKQFPGLSTLLHVGSSCLTAAEVVKVHQKLWETLTISPEMAVTEVKKEDAKKGFDTAWTRDSDKVSSYLDTAPVSHPRNSSELKQTIANSVWRITCARGSKRLKVHCFAVSTGYVIIPFHFVAAMKEPETWTFLMHNRGGLGDRSFVETISPSCISRIYYKDSRDGVTCNLLCDAAVVAIGKGPPISKAVITTIPEFAPNTVSEYADIYYRSEDGSLRSSIASEMYCEDCHSHEKELYKGVSYIWTEASPGMCMAPICPASNQTAVVAFHTGSIVENNRSVAVCLSREGILSAISKLQGALKTVIPHASMGDFPESINGTQTLLREVKLKSNMARITGPCNAAMYGSSTNVNRTIKTKVKRHRCYAAVKAAFPYLPDYAGPQFRPKDGAPYRIWDVNLEKVNHRAPGLPREDLEGALREFSDELFAPLEGNLAQWKEEIFPLTYQQAHDGVSGKRYFDSLNWQTSGGFGFPGSKRGYILSEKVHNNGYIERELDPCVRKEFDRIIGCWKRNECSYSPYTSSLKDEPTKVGKTKVRTFQACNIASLIAMKTLFAPAVRYLQLNRDISGIMVGMNPYSDEWSAMVDNLNSVGKGFFFALDYKSYDLHIEGKEITCFVCWVQELYRRLNFPDELIRMVGACAADLYKPVVDWNGDMIQIDMLPSGVFLTSALGSFVGILRLKACFRRIYNRPSTSIIRWAVQGDDNVTKVNWKWRKFNAATFASYLEIYGIPVTSVDKESAIEPRISESSVSFLKRKIRYCPHRRRKVAPLELESILKRLMCYMQTEADPREVFGQNVDGALMELSLHPKEIFEEVKAKVVKIVKDFRMEPFTRNTGKPYEWYFSNGPTQCDSSAFKGCSSQVLNTSGFFSTETLLGLLGVGELSSREPARVPRPRGQPPSNGYAEDNGEKQLAANKNQFNFLTFGRDPGQGIKKEIPRVMQLTVHPESSSQENLQFMENEPLNLMKDLAAADPTRSSRDNDLASLGDFLARPVKIGDFSYSTSSAFYERFDPWSLFLENPRIINRISNFKNLRGTLVVKILLNGNSFYYGRLLCSYQPLEVYDNMTANAGLVPQDLIQMSQFPNIRLNPTVSQTGEMKLPFLYMKDYVDIVNSEWSQLGKITIRQINQLKQTSGEVLVSNTLPVTVYAYMTDVSLVGLTSSNPNTIVPQMDERELGEDGPIKKTATAVAKAAGVLEKIPQIAPFAMPARVGAEAIGAIAGANGWCAPSNVKSNELVEPRGAGHTAVIDHSDTAMKLTMDSKQETTIDPRVFGIDEPDALNVKNIASRESYLTTFNWAHGTPTNSLLWNSIVDPCVHDKIVAPDTNADTVFFPACCGVTVPFKYWTGSMKFRFEVVRSAFHKGRIAIVYDPVGTPANREDNVNQVQIVDISSCEDFTVALEPMQDVGPMEHILPGSRLREDIFGTEALGVQTVGNGTISVWVINPLTLPNEPSTSATGISVNVYVSCDDLELYGPQPDYTFFTVKPQSGEEEDKPYSDFGCDSVVKFLSKSHTPDEYQNLRRYCRWIERQLKRAKKAVNSEVKPEMDELEVGAGDENPIGTELGSIEKNQNFDKVYFGESIESARSLLKRYNSYFLQKVPGGNNLEQFCLEMNAFPLYRGNMGPESIHTSLVGGNYNYVATTLINYFACAFQVKKGSVRYKIITRGGGSADMSPTSATVSINYIGKFNTATVDLDGVTDSHVAYAGTEALNNYPRASGTALFAPRVNPVLEFEVPWYSQWRFEPGKRIDYMSKDYAHHPTFPGFTLAMDNDNFSDSGLDIFTAAGEDFTLNMFTGWPRMYLEVPPLP